MVYLDKSSSEDGKRVFCNYAKSFPCGFTRCSVAFTLTDSKTPFFSFLFFFLEVISVFILVCIDSQILKKGLVKKSYPLTTAC